jgi:glycosyltransferase involved in cell wall biosynthesis
MRVAGGLRGRQQDGVDYLGRVPDGELVALYQGASAYLDTSRYEGFGFQALEALASGAPVVATDTTSLPEVVDGGGVLCAPGDEECLVTQLVRLLEDRAHADGLRRAGLEHARTFRWERTAEVIAAVVDEVVGA